MSLAEFRRGWMKREKRGFPPLRMTTVYRVRPWTPEDRKSIAERLLGHLYGEFVPATR